jgi:uncharacterized protein YcbK (DUF882 family)
VVFLLLFVLAPGTLLRTAQATGETRTLKIYHVHTGERAVITFKKDGRYLPDGLKQLNTILRDWRRNEPTRMDPRLFDLLWEVYQKSGSSEYIHVVCGYRAPATNEMLRVRSRGVAKFSQHTLGKAIDFFIPDVPLAKLRVVGLKLGIGGVGFYPTSGSPFVHMDVGSPRYWPRMSRDELLALFPDGKTMYVPSDGQPLPGYEQAVAAYEARQAKGGEIRMASASAGASGGRKRTLLGFLFGQGGGADEVDDSADNSVIGSSVATAEPPAPAAAVRTAPAPAAVSSVAEADGSLDLPSVAPVLPVPRPARAPEIPVQTVASALAPMATPPTVLASATQSPDVPRPAAEIAAASPDDAADASPGFAVPIPVARPSRGFELAAAPTPETRPTAVVAALLPQPRPDRTGAFIEAVIAGTSGSRQAASSGTGTTAQASGDSTDQASVRLASVSPAGTQRRTLLAAGATADPLAAIATGVRTSAKDARIAAADEYPEAAPDIVPVSTVPPHMLAGVSLASVALPAKRTREPGGAILMAPTVIYTTGFQKRSPPVPGILADRAVTFFSVAKFASL